MVPLTATRQIADELRALGLLHVQWTPLKHAPHDTFLMERHVDEIAETIALCFGRLVDSDGALIGVGSGSSASSFRPSVVSLSMASPCCLCDTSLPSPRALVYLFRWPNRSCEASHGPSA